MQVSSIQNPLRYLPEILLGLFPAAVFTMLMTHPIWDADIFWQLRLGEEILRVGHPINRELFSAPHLGEPLPTMSWLAQAVMAQVRIWFGWRGLQLFDGLLWLGGFMAAARAARLAGASAGGILFAQVLALIFILQTASIRPQSFAMLCFGLLILLIKTELPTWRKIGVMVLLLIVWQNLHPSVSIAAVYLGGVAGAAWLSWLMGKRQDAPWLETGLVVVSALSQFATPDGLSVIYNASVNFKHSVAVGATEWLPIWHSANVSAARSMIVILVVTAVMIVHGWKIDWQEVLPAGLLLVAAIMAFRFMPFWLIAMIPVIARTVPSNNKLPTKMLWLLPVASLATAVIVTFRQPAQFSSIFPLAQLDALRATDVTGTVFADGAWNGVVIDRGYPRWRVTFDSRYYRYSAEEFSLHFAIERGEVSLRTVEAIFHPNAWLLHPERNARLISELRQDPRWRVLAEDGLAVTFVPALRRS